jgi:hypothetical protein
MTLVELESAATAHTPLPSDADPLLRALWDDATGNWEGAHDLVQKIESADAAWIHAYLHRKEGDLPNAQYWYRRAGKPVASGPLPDEWREIARALLEAATDSVGS